MKASLDELEQLSRLLAGEATEEERVALQALMVGRPELVQMETWFRKLDEVSGHMPVLLDPAREGLLIAQILERQQAKRRGRRWLQVVGGVGLAMALGVAAAIVLAVPPAQLVIVQGPVRVDGNEVPVGWRKLARRRLQIDVGAEGAAVLGRGSAELFLPRQASVEISPRDLRLRGGTLLATGNGLLLLGGDGAEVELQGTAVFSLEPEEALVRVTTAVEANPTEGTMREHWMKLGAPVLSAAVATGLTVYVMSGHAVAQVAGAPPVSVPAGFRWSSGAPKPVTFERARSAPAAPGVAEQLGRKSMALERTEPSDLAALERPQLVALVERLRSDKEALITEQHALRRDMEAAAAAKKENYFRLSSAELIDLAHAGEARFRLPQLEGGTLKYDQKARLDAELTPQEERAIAEIYEKSAERLRNGLLALYDEIGGDLNTAQDLSTTAILSELKNKCLAGDFERAVRQVGRERAGLLSVAADAPASPSLRAFRLLWHEDDRVIEEVERLLGAARAERLLNHSGTRHSSHGFGVGPEK